MTDLVKQYIVQCISTASNNLRLSSEKIEVVAILKDHINKCDNVETTIRNMKKLTALSKLAIRLDDVYKFIANSKIDFLKISERFKEHSHLLIRDLNNMLDVVTPHNMKDYIADLNTQSIDVELSSEKSKSDQFDNFTPKEDSQPTGSKQSSSSNEINLKEEFIFEDLREKEEINFEDFEKAILKPIKEIDSFLKELNTFNYDNEDLDSYIEIMKVNTELSKKIGFDIITNMHEIFTRSLVMLKEGVLTPVPEIIENMRACLIVVVAVVRQKEVNITSYLNKAEKFGKMIFSNKRNF